MENSSILKRIELENYKCHENKIIDFVPGLNVIVGETDKGKSAILGALYWILSPKPTGGNFRRIDLKTKKISKRTSVKAYFEDGLIVSKIRTTSKNEYQINDMKPLKAVGRSVPDIIKKNINISSINFQRQADPHLFLSETSGKIAEQLNKFAGLDQIDSSSKNIKNMISENKSKFDLAEIEIENLACDLDEYKDLDKMELDVQKLEELTDEQLSITSQKQNIEELLESLKEIETTITDLDWLDVADDKIKSLSLLIKQKSDIELEIESIQSHIKSLGELDNQLEKTKNIISVEKIINNIEILLEQKSEIESKIYEIEECITKLQDTEDDIKSLTIQINKKQEEFDKLMPDTCPLCDQEIK